MKKVLVLNGTFNDECCRAARVMLAENGWEIIFCPPKEDMPAILPALDAVMASGEIWDRETIKKCGKLKIISRFGVGYENIDIAAAREMGVDVAIARVAALSDSVAELALGLILSLLRDIHTLGGELRRGRWTDSHGMLLTGKTVGLVGFGSIAQALAKLLNGFNVKLLAWDAAPNEEAAARLGVIMTDFNALLSESDVISVHVPDTLKTRNLINGDSFNIMKKTAVFINTARGKIVDESALYMALKERRIAFAACDVFASEPADAANPLLALGNFLGVPHIGGNTGEAAHEMSVCAVQNILDCFAGKKPANLIN